MWTDGKNGWTALCEQDHAHQKNPNLLDRELNQNPSGCASLLHAPARKQVAFSFLQYLYAIRANLDIDGNGKSDALTDGPLLLRYLFGLRGNSLIVGAVSSDATRKDATQIEAYIQSIVLQ